MSEQSHNLFKRVLNQADKPKSSTIAPSIILFKLILNDTDK